MQIGIGLPNAVRDVRPTVIPAWARRAEEAGFSTLGTLGRIAYPSVMDTAALAAAAGATTSIGLMSSVLIGPAWPPVLLAKELAGIDAMSGGRLTLGLGLGGRADDFVVEGLGPRGVGKRLDEDLEVYDRVWRGEIVGAMNPAVPAGTRRIPLMFGGLVPAAFDRMVRWGAGCIGGPPLEMATNQYDMARAAWRNAGRGGSPRIVGELYFAFGDSDAGRRNVHDYYSILGTPLADMMTATLLDDPAAAKRAVEAFADLGADEVIFTPWTDDIDEVVRLADAVQPSSGENRPVRIEVTTSV